MANRNDIMDSHGVSGLALLSDTMMDCPLSADLIEMMSKVKTRD